MKFILILLAIFLIKFNGYSQSAHGNGFIVERYRQSDYAFPPNFKKQLTEKRRYSADSDLLFKVEYHGLQLYDSTMYVNQNHKIIKLVSFNNLYGLKERENIDYIYKDDSLVDVKINKTEFSQSTKQDFIRYLPQINTLGFKDPLGILEDDFADFDIEGIRPSRPSQLKNGTQIITERAYIVNSTAQGLFNYNIPHHAYLKRINLYYTKDKTLLKDEFIYDGFILKRNYSYTSQGIKSIKVTKLKNHRIISTDEIVFKYILL